MQKRNDETLVAYLDGELDTAERRDIEAWLDADPGARERVAALAQSADLVRSAYADIVNEPVPERLLAAARGETSGKALPREAQIVPLRRPVRRVTFVNALSWRAGLAAAWLSTAEWPDGWSPHAGGAIEREVQRV